MKLKQLLSRDNNDRVFIFYSVDKLKSEQLYNIKKKLNYFFSTWVSHTDKIDPELIILYNHFIIISTCKSNISGCSIDSLMHEIKNIQSELNVVLLDRRKIPYCLLNNLNIGIEESKDVEVSFLEYRDFIQKYSKKKNHDNILIFNTTITFSNDLWIISLNDWIKFSTIG